MKLKTFCTHATLLGIASSALFTAAASDNHHYTPGQGGHIMVTPDQLDWGSVASMEGDAKITIIEGNLAEEAPFTIRLRLPENYIVHPHVHPAYERVTVLSGTFHFAHGDTFDRDATMALTPGSFAIMAPGEPMFAFTEEETIIQLHGEGPWGIDYIHEEHDPRN
ncbi:hypothetical protein J2T57_003469 [Natronocella acetinitrilica]|uniref:Cupin n=1 Tax=Natronocella acetinitrilica TaxID=414046 RepID=A0AAE3KC02_9GAMM|nr:cupin domain-containing protein [Natronocella acetinitrilica]MCP1676310.1 hypothetical protein [Natronocella acetinitrilica]